MIRHDKSRWRAYNSQRSPPEETCPAVPSLPCEGCKIRTKVGGKSVNSYQ
jgi:hypothetical protein